ncbi:MAG TPA: protein-disulfide reductase DsbD [Burkholderiales bacterium]|nr:protein-disulfide reductase DsbD [Burkholderiales bacterium]
MRLLFLLLMLLSAFAHAGEPELLEPEKAFQLSAQWVNAKDIKVRYQIADGYYLYRDRFSFELEPKTFSLDKPQMPPGNVHEDQFFGRVETYRGDLIIHLPLRQTGPSQTLTLNAVAQGCADIGVCYSPLVQKIDLKLGAADMSGPPPVNAVAALRSAQVSATDPLQTAATSEAPLGDESSRAANLLRGGGFWLIIASFFGFGLLLSLTPCVFPMIPILSGIIVGQKRRVTRTRGLLLSASYVLGVAVTYAIAGVAAGLTGTLISTTLQNPWVLAIFAALFVLLALSMFGFYELQFPASLQSRLSNAAFNIKGGNLIGAFVMGGLSAVIIGPCVAAPLAGALLYISQTRDVFLGGSSLFVMALGMGTPLIAVGLSAGALLPKAGPWMNTVKKFFGVLLLGVAIWLVSSLIPEPMHLLLWASLVIVCAIYLIVALPVTSAYARYWKGAGIAAVAAVFLIGVFSGGLGIFGPLAQISSAVKPAQELKFQRVKSNAELDQALLDARGKYVMLDFYADWCVSCKEMALFTFSDSAVQARLKAVRLLQADVTADNADDQALLKRFGLYGPPGILFFDRQGNEIKTRVIGYQNPATFLATLNSVM